MTRDYKGNAALAVGEVFDPSPSNIDSRTTRATIAGGFKTTMLPKATRGKTVNAVITLRFGSDTRPDHRDVPPASRPEGPHRLADLTCDRRRS